MSVEKEVNGVPKYELIQLVPKSSKYCICVFVINEGKKVQKQLMEMKKVCHGIVDIIVADGGSTDGSLSLEFLKLTGVTALLVKRGEGKLSAQMRMAFYEALEQGYKGVITIDGNGKDGLEAIQSFVDALEQGFDHVQGSRFIKGGRAINTPLSRLIGLKLLHAPLISLSSGKRHTDTTNGFRAYSAKLLTDHRVKPFRDVFQAYELHYYLAIRSSKLGMKLTEVPVSRSYPKTGKTPTKISPIKGNILVLKNLFKAALYQYDPELKK